MEFRVKRKNTIDIVGFDEKYLKPYSMEISIEFEEDEGQLILDVKKINSGQSVGCFGGPIYLKLNADKTPISSGVDGDITIEEFAEHVAENVAEMLRNAIDDQGYIVIDRGLVIKVGEDTNITPGNEFAEMLLLFLNDKVKLK